MDNLKNTENRTKTFKKAHYAESYDKAQDSHTENKSGYNDSQNNSQNCRNESQR